MSFSSDVLLLNAHIIVSVNLIFIIKNINISSEYLYSAMLLRFIFKEVKKKIVQSNSILFCSSVSFSSFICFRMRMKV